MGCVDCNFRRFTSVGEKRSRGCRNAAVYIVSRVSVIHWKCLNRFNHPANQYTYFLWKTQLHFYKQSEYIIRNNGFNEQSPMYWLNICFIFHFYLQFSISCVIVLLVKMESVYAISPNAISPIQQAAWLGFLTALVCAVEKLGNLQLANVAFENDILKPLLNHFARFRDLKSQPLIAVLTQKNS